MKFLQVLAIQRVKALLFGLGLLLSPVVATATPIFFSGSDTITHDADVDDPLPAANVNNFALPAFNSTQYSDTINDGDGSSTGNGGLSHFESDNVVGFDAPGGIGVDQTDIDHVDFVGAAILRIDFIATWDFTTNFGPDITYFINAPLGGTVGAGGGGFVAFNIQATANAVAPGTANHTWGGTYFNSTPGPFAFFVGVNDPQVGDFFAVNKKGSMSGFVEFIARSGQEGTSSIELAGSGLIVPEPSSFLLLGLGLLCLGVSKTRKRWAKV